MKKLKKPKKLKFKPTINPPQQFKLVYPWKKLYPITIVLSFFTGAVLEYSIIKSGFCKINKRKKRKK